MPIVEAKISEGDPCLERTEEASTPGRYHYPLLKHLNQKGCKSSINNEFFTDQRYEKIDQ